MRRWYGISFGLTAILGVIWLVLYLSVLNQPIPRKVLNQAGFGVWYPQRGTLGFMIDRSSVKFSVSGSDGLVSLTARSPSNSVTFTEQAVPATFNDVPQLYDAMIQKLLGYASFASINGTVSLTHPVELKGGQTAVLIAQGTLVFVKPAKDLGVDDWHRIMNSLVFVH